MKYIPSFLAALSCLPSLILASFGFYQANGQTRLLGSSFGQLGTNATFDYVIIGGGTSGLTVAKRLAEQSNSVAVIEGGSFYEISNGNLSQIPADDVFFASASPSDIQPLVDWGIVTQPQLQLNGREIHYTQGKCLGGSSARNFLAFHRGTVGSYQQWADRVGDQSFIFANLLPFFKRSPQLTPPNLAKRRSGPVKFDPAAFDPAGGPLQASYTNFFQPLSPFIEKAFRAADRILGITLTIDPQASTRSSSETSFLQSSLAYQNYQIYQQTIAKQILFDTNKTATGVKVTTDNIQYVLSARKEVILAAGVFRSPQMLMVSGIGPASKLEQLGIPVIADLPGVGQNLQDQPLYTLSYRVSVPTNSRLTSDPSFALQAIEDFLTNQTGPLTSPGGNFVGWEKLPAALRTGLSNGTLADLGKFPADWPELELLPLAASAAPTNDSDNYAAVSIAVLTTTSRGNVTINSSDTSVNPLISPNWLLTITDQELAIAGFKRARQIANATGVIVGPEFSPGPDVQTNAQMLEFIKETLAPIHHAVGTCSMGKSSDPKAVVDTTGKVIGFSGLRIVDASVFALLPPGHTQASVYMLAEKLAADILAEQG